MTSDLVAFAKDNWNVIWAARWAFAVWTVAVATAIWAILSYLKSNQIASFEARLKLREDEIAGLKLASARDQTPPQRAGEARRNELIADGRRLIAAFNAQDTERVLDHFLRAQPEWYAIRAQLDPKVRADIENGRLTVVTRSGVKDGKVYHLQQDLDRLEREWDLT